MDGRMVEVDRQQTLLFYSTLLSVQISYFYGGPARKIWKFFLLKHIKLRFGRDFLGSKRQKGRVIQFLKRINRSILETSLKRLPYN